MKRNVFTIIGAYLALLLFFPFNAQDSYGQGMMGGYGMGMMGYGGEISIPEKLEKPKSEEWVGKLQEVFSLEKLSQAQYEADRIKYHAQMPYGMIGLQEIDHISWIEGLLNAYGIKPNSKQLAIKATKDLTDAYKTAMQMESNLVPLDEWLIANSPDATATEVLETVLYQTRMHYVMFSHALQMTGFEGKGRRRGGYGMGMGHGMMMGGYGMGMGHGMGMGYGMMGGYGMGYDMMGSYAAKTNPACAKFFDETVDQRKKIIDLHFKYSEALRDPKTTVEQLDKISNEAIELQNNLYKKMPADCR